MSSPTLHAALRAVVPDLQDAAAIAGISDDQLLDQLELGPLKAINNFLRNWQEVDAGWTSTT